ncbi:HD domain-containing protein [uncultured Desulfovibrio sp.]|nr:HD domain-containing protein [uncultured Desulfovibrio sp.]
MNFCHSTSMNIYLVGGAVRDLLLGRLPREWDYAFEGTRDDFLREYPDACAVGAVQVCLRQGREFMPLRGATIQEDLHHRDLTVNALALDAAGRLHAHPQAVDDLRNHVLRPASPSALADDPGRIFRLARFAACWPDWRLAPEAWEQLSRQEAAALAALPAERVGRELLKALAGPVPGRFLRVLAEGNCLRPWFAELAEAARIPAGPPRWHGNNSVLDHTCEVMDRCAGDALAVWMALCHDLGKLRTPPDSWPHHYGHDALGVPLARALCERLALSSLHGKAAETACADHMRAGRYDELRTGTRRDLLWRVDRRGLSRPFWRLTDADSRSPFSVRAERELTILRAVRLPDEWRNRGPDSARHLRDLHCAALAAARTTDETKN